MKNTIKIIAIAAFILANAGACKKKSSSTSIPSGVIACKVNGTAWQSSNASTQYHDKYDTMVYGTSAELRGDTVLLLNGVKVNGTDSSSVRIIFRLTSGKTGVYSGTNTAKYGGIYATGFDFDHIFIAVLNYNSTYNVEITKLDVANKKVSGKFSMNMIPKTSGTSYNVTEGEFTDVVFKVK